jgi:hypothetical protein
MEAHRKFWNEQQQALRQKLERPGETQNALELVLNQHAMLHSAEMSQTGLWSFEDEALAGVSEEKMRIIPGNCEHSIAWAAWHMTRIEDACMNLLVAGSAQVLLGEGWLERLGTGMRDTGNALPAGDVAELSERINLPALRAYRRAVGRRTREIVKLLQTGDLSRKVEARRLEQMRLEGAVPEAASGLLDYWGGLTVAGLLLMPATRHIYLHWNEVVRIRIRVMR